MSTANSPDEEKSDPKKNIGLSSNTNDNDVSALSSTPPVDNSSDLQSNNNIDIFPFDQDEKNSRSALMMINPSAVETLAHNAPEKLIDFANLSDDRQYNYYSKLAEYRHTDNRNRENTIRLALGSVFGIVLMAFVYAGFTKDNTLPTQLINTLVGGAGGLGVSSFLQKKKED